MARAETRPLRRGWTTGACAAAAARAAFAALLTGRFPDPVTIRLPRGEMPSFPLALSEMSDGIARAGIVKDAGDDPDVTQGALVIAELAWADPGSVLGTTGIVVPYSCASWIHAIHRGIDVARAAGLDHIAAATGTTSERAVQRFYELPEHALIDMGDFVGGTLKYLRRRPVARLTLAGGFAKLAKLAAGHLDLHSSKSRVDGAALARLLAGLGADPAVVAAAGSSDSAAEILTIAGERQIALAEAVARQAREVALATLSGATTVEVAIVDRAGDFLALAGNDGAAV